MICQFVFISLMIKPRYPDARGYNALWAFLNKMAVWNVFINKFIHFPIDLPTLHDALNRKITFELLAIFLGTAIWVKKKVRMRLGYSWFNFKYSCLHQHDGCLPWHVTLRFIKFCTVIPSQTYCTISFSLSIKVVQ